MGNYFKALWTLLFNQPAPPQLPLPNPTDQGRFAFGLECYKQIRAEVTVLLARIENLFRYSLLVSAGVFSWLLTQGFGLATVANKVVPCTKLPVTAMHVAWCLPAAFILLSALLTLAAHIRVMQMSGFLEQCEQSMGFRSLSWEAYLRPLPPLFFKTTAYAWLLMFAAACGAAVLGWSLASDLCPPSAAK